MAGGNVVIGKSIYAHSCGAEKGGGQEVAFRHKKYHIF